MNEFLNSLSIGILSDIPLPSGSEVVKLAGYSLIGIGLLYLG